MPGGGIAPAISRQYRRTRRLFSCTLSSRGCCVPERCTTKLLAPATGGGARAHSGQATPHHSLGEKKELAYLVTGCVP